MKALLMPGMGYESLQRQMDQLFESLGREEFLPEFPSVGMWVPRVDLSETQGDFVVRAEIAGIEPKDFKVDYRDGVLTLHGEKRREVEDKSERFYRSERTYGAFSRSLRLPTAIDPARVQAVFKNGVLTVTLPKAPQAVGATIPVKAA
jgi:HSP20 family protein